MSEARRIKSRAGCQTCKRRKVKCDGGLPDCQQCQRQKLQCPGYQKPLKWIDASGAISSHSPAPSLPESLNDESSNLIQHYFTRVYRIAGCFDSDVSPFRIVPASMMAYSKPVHLLMQASSAALLSRQQTKMRLKALSLQSEAFSAVRTEIGKLQGLRVSDELMLSSIIAGLTSAWYDVNDIGLSHILGSQVLLSIWLKSQNRRLKYQQTFILGAYIYWFMIAAFVSGDPWSSFMYQEALQQTVLGLEMSHDIVDDTYAPDNLRKVFPHPLTGFSMLLYISIGKVGSLCRLKHSMTTLPESLRTFVGEKARSIETELLDLDLSRQSSFQDPQDPYTTVDEILKVGEAFRFAGLLQIYATFPHLLQRQAQHSAMNVDFASLGIYTSPQMDSNGSSPVEEVVPVQRNWLRALGFHILKILEPVPATSGTRGYLGLPVLIAGTWLIDPMDMNSPDPPDNGDQMIFEHSRLRLLECTDSKEHWREIVWQGLRRHNDYVGLQQVSRILEILEEVWHLDDSGTTKCDWMVVVASKYLQTLYG